jgi:ribosome-associated protein
MGFIVSKKSAATAKQTQRQICAALEDAKSKDICLLDVRKICDFTDYMVIVTGTSNRHVQAIADRVIDRLRDHGRRPAGVEGVKTGDWVLVDFSDFVVNVMRAQTRDFYNLEKLWGDGKKMQCKA